MSKSLSRRQIIKTGFLAAISSPIMKASSASSLLDIAEPAIDANPWRDFKVGIASYTFRKMSLEDTIKALQRLGLKYISIKDFHLSLNSSTTERKAAMKKLYHAGITAMSCGNITLQNDEKNIKQGL